MRAVRLSLAVLFGSFTLWAQVAGSNPGTTGPTGGPVDTSAFSLSSHVVTLFSTASLAGPPETFCPKSSADAENGAWQLPRADPFPAADGKFRLADGLAAPPQNTSTRPKAFSYSDGYLVRRKIHKYASFATLPLFIGQAIVGQKLYDGGGSDSLRGAHSGLAAGVAVLFGVNTVTGAWNLWEARQNPNGRTKRLVHGILMLCADAGFVATGALAPEDEESRGAPSGGRASTHRTVAFVSMGIAAVGYLYMLLSE